MKIIKNIFINELYLIAFLVFQEILRLLMKAGDYLSIDLKLAIIMIISVAILSVIQQFVKDTFKKNQSNSEKIS